jgi:hypothetical protein
MPKMREEIDEIPAMRQLGLGIYSRIQPLLAGGERGGPLGVFIPSIPSGRERDLPVIFRLPINTHLPHKPAARPQGDGAKVVGKGHIDGCASGDPRWPADLKLAAELNGFFSGRAMYGDRAGISVKQLQFQLMPQVCLVPRHLDLQRDR